MTLTRRRFIAISAAAAMPVPALAETASYRWHGAALGARASITLASSDPKQAQAVTSEVEAEIVRLEMLFSLYRRDSAVSVLNRTGRLDMPAPEMLELINLAQTVNRHTRGAFDPSVQPLWQLYAYASAQPSATEVAEARRRTGWRHLRYDTGAIRFARPGMALTFNGIAQGFIADKVAALLRARGFRDVLVDIGEINALGTRPDGTPWRAGIATPDGTVIQRVALTDRALATSSPLGTVLDRAGAVGHILDPNTGRPAGRWSLVTVSAHSAAIADALSTAFCVMSRDAIRQALPEFPGMALEALKA